MAKRIFVTATNTDIGKTYTTKLLLREYASRGLRIGVIKPVETGVVDGIYPDGDALLSLVKELNAEFQDIMVEDIVPISYELPAAPYIASNVEKFDFEKVNAAVYKLEKLCDVLIFEGAGGLYVPIDEEYMLIDLINYYNTSALLVTHGSLGCINDTLMSQEALEKANVKYTTVFNIRENDKSFEIVSQPYFLKTMEKVLKTDSNIDTICDVLYNL